MSLEDNVEAGTAAKLIFGAALDEAAGLGEERAKHFWKRLSYLIADFRKPPRAPSTTEISREESCRIGKLAMTRGKYGPTSTDSRTVDQTPMDYLEWVADNWDDSFGDAVRKYLESPRIQSERR